MLQVSYMSDKEDAPPRDTIRHHVTILLSVQIRTHSADLKNKVKIQTSIYYFYK